MKRVGDWTLHGLRPTEKFYEVIENFNDVEPSKACRLRTIGPFIQEPNLQTNRKTSFFPHTSEPIRTHFYFYIFYFTIIHTYFMYFLYFISFVSLPTYNSKITMGGYAIIFISPLELDCSPTIVVHILINIVTS